MTRQQDAHLLSGAYSLDAVTPEEAALVEAAMRESEDLRAEIVGLVDTAVALGQAVPSAAPPLALRSRLLAAIEDLPQERAEPSETVPAMPVGDHVVPRRRRRIRRPSMILAAVAVAALLFSGGFLLQRAVLAPQTNYYAVATATDAHQVSGAVRGGGTLAVSWSPSQARTAVSVAGVKVPSGKTLQLWHVRGGSTTSAGLYGDWDVIDGTPKPGDSLAVSIEPSGGSKQPTRSQVIAVVPLQA